MSPVRFPCPKSTQSDHVSCKISDVIDQLFPTLSSDKVTSFSCGHVIPETSLRALVVTKGPRGEALDYKSGRQGDACVVRDEASSTSHA